MPLNALSITAFLFYFGGMFLFAVSFIKIAAMFHELCKEKAGCKFVPKTALFLAPLLIAVGSTGFIFVSFVFLYKTISLNPPFGLRYFAMAACLFGSLFIAFGFNRFYQSAKSRNLIKG
ncbi:MAG: hypothetical protein ABH986_06555 [archaeon]